MSKVCRLCIRQDDLSESLMDLPPEDLVSKGLEEIFHIKVEKDDKKPHHICAWCKDKVLDFYLFFLRVKSNETKLEREAIALKIKTEPGTAPSTPNSSFKINEHKIDTTVIVLDSDDDDDNDKKREITTDTKPEPVQEPVKVKTEPGTEKKRKRVENTSQESKSKKIKDIPIIPNKTPQRLSLKLFNNPASQSTSSKDKPIIPEVKTFVQQPSKPIPGPPKPRTNSVPQNLKSFTEKLLCLKKNHESMSEDQMIKVFYELKCNICEMDLDFETFQDLADHHKADHQDENYRVECCSVKIPRFYLLSHIRHHLGLEKMSLKQHVESLNAQFFCDLCGKTFVKDHVLQFHLKFDHAPGDVMVEQNTKVGKELYTCDLCGVSFPHLFNIRNHINTKHLRILRFSCHFCDKKYYHYKALETHMLKEHEDQYKNSNHLNTYRICHICQKPCRQQTALEIHLLSHLSASEKKELSTYCCSYCDFKSYSEYIITQHEKKMHINRSLAYECNVCNKKFDARIKLHYHQASHLDKADQYKLMPHQCPYCEKRFWYESTVSNHIGSAHRCNVCKDIFITPESMNIHKKEVHHMNINIYDKRRTTGSYQGSYVCEYCDKTFRLNESLQVHLREWHLGGHLYECEWCDAKYNCRKSFGAHKKKSHPDKFLVKME